jgi:hypothetical protein
MLGMRMIIIKQTCLMTLFHNREIPLSVCVVYLVLHTREYFFYDSSASLLLPTLFTSLASYSRVDRKKKIYLSLSLYIYIRLFAITHSFFLLTSFFLLRHIVCLSNRLYFRS